MKYGIISFTRHLNRTTLFEGPVEQVKLSERQRDRVPCPRRMEDRNDDAARGDELLREDEVFHASETCSKNCCERCMCPPAGHEPAVRPRQYHPAVPRVQLAKSARANFAALFWYSTISKSLVANGRPHKRPQSTVTG